VQGLREESMISYFNRYIPTAAALGGICVGLLTISADLMGAIGSGTGILLATNIIYGFYEQYEKDGKEGGGQQVY
jgi:protein transport protein SEC61 subunit alpha